MLNLATNLFIAYIIYFLRSYSILLFNKEARINHRGVRSRLNELRSKNKLSVSEQKEFINLKTPKSKTSKSSFRKSVMSLLKIGLMVFIFLMVRKLWSMYIVFLFSLWQVFLIMIFLPILLNSILKRFGLEQDDLRVFFRR